MATGIATGVILYLGMTLTPLHLQPQQKVTPILLQDDPDAHLAPVNRLNKTGNFKVIINARYRTGSSFVASFFQFHPLVHYTFEPFQFYPGPFTIKRLLYLKGVAERRLREVLSCNYSALINDSNRIDAVRQSGRVNFWWRIALCRETLSTEACPRTLDTLQTNCKLAKYHVVKEIYATNFSSLVSLMKTGVKVIHLVRDPRGQFNSILSIHGKTKSFKAKLLFGRKKITEICDDLRETFCEIHKAITLDPKLVHHYKIVRYEDIAMAPVKWAKELYNFAGIPPDGPSLNHIRNITSHQSVGSFSIYRKSKSMPFTWIRTLPKLLQMVAEQRCYDVMHMLGYPRVDLIDVGDISRVRLGPLLMDVPTCPYKL